MAENQNIEMADDRPPTVAALFERIRRERGALERLVSSMSNDDLIANSDGWTVKVDIAHVAARERRLIGEIQGDQAAAQFGPDEGDYETANIDDLNAIPLTRFQVDSPAASRAEFLAAGEALRSAIAELRDAGLSGPHRGDEEDETVLDRIPWDTYKHYPEHVAAISNHRAERDFGGFSGAFADVLRPGGGMLAAGMSGLPGCARCG